MRKNQDLLPGIRNRKGTPPKLEEVTTVNTEKAPPSAMKQINMLVPKEKKLEIMNYAKEHDSDTTKTLLAAFDEYKKNHP